MQPVPGGCRPPLAALGCSSRLSHQVNTNAVSGINSQRRRFLCGARLDAYLSQTIALREGILWLVYSVLQGIRYPRTSANLRIAGVHQDSSYDAMILICYLIVSPGNKNQDTHSPRNGCLIISLSTNTGPLSS